ncbi:50S ribosome-binding GTPase, partial [Patescibacteria group bacterium]|nr:50S ribosome-binding GTPase [Patescibacteria group bacterium]
ADYGLIGLPSSGKSSLLNELTNAKAKTAEYHFTTLSPNLGVLPNKKIIADIPGLIEGASQGKGLGIKFLKHIQKVSLLLHCVSSDSTDPVSDYKVIRKELGEYSKNLLNKKEMILLTKSDLTDEKGIKKVRTELKNLDRKIISTSIYDGNSIENLLKVLQ